MSQPDAYDDEVNPLPDYVELGFIDEKGPASKVSALQSRLGGRPAWLVPEHLPPVSGLLCGVCQRPMPLLVQLYAPDERFDRSYHRTIMVFCCRTGTCHKKPTEWCADRALVC